jgi:DNA uptake protein ComE-like DNA-binding protein
MRHLIRSLAVVTFLAGSTAFAQAKPATRPAPAPGPAAAAKAPPAAKAAPVDINTATAAELEAFPGIGKAYAAKIIGGRPYANKLQLVQKKILTQAMYDMLKDRLIAKQ